MKRHLVGDGKQSGGEQTKIKDRNNLKGSREEARFGQDFDRRTNLGDYRKRNAMSAGSWWIDIVFLQEAKPWISYIGTYSSIILGYHDARTTSRPSFADSYDDV